MKKVILTTLLTFALLAMANLAFAQNGEELLTNGDFEDGRAPWTDTAGEIRTEGGNSFFFADVASAGDAFAVNLSQAGLEIIQDSVYTFTFDASTSEGNSRTMIVGIGLNEAPFTAAIETVTLTESDSTYTLELQANFGSTDGRVLFDMGAETGIVVIDNVSLVQGGEVSEEPAAPAPEVAAPTPPDRNAEDVISVYSDAYANIGVTTLATEWSQGSLTDEVEIESGEFALQYSIGNFFGIQLENGNDLTNFTHMHFDYWVADESVGTDAILNPKLSNHAGLPDTEGETNAIGSVNPVSTVGEWVSFDVALDDFTSESANGSLDRESIYQIVMTTAGTISDVYIDNIYFYNQMATSIDGVNESPNRFTLNQNFPNPFNPSTTISYNIPESANVKLEVFNAVGQKVATLINGTQNAGSHTVSFDASNLASGIYLYKLTSGNQVKINKMTLVK